MSTDSDKRTSRPKPWNGVSADADRIPHDRPQLAPSLSHLPEDLERQYANYRWAESRANLFLSSDIVSRVRVIARNALTGAGGRQRVLDVGCGSGRVLRRVREDMPGGTAVGLDVLPRFALGRDLFFVSGDARDLPFASDTFDLTLLMTVLSSVSDRAAREAILAECVRVTRRGGTVVVYDFVVKNPLNRYTHAVSTKLLSAALGASAAVRVDRVTLNPVLTRLIFGTGLPWAAALCRSLARLPFLRHHVLAQAVKL